MKNRANVVASILQNGKLLRDVYSSSQNSFGSAEEELQKYQDSISGHLAKLQNQWQQAWARTANRDVINFFLDLGSVIMGVVDKFGLLKTAALAIFGGYGVLFKAAKKQTTIFDFLQDGLTKGKDIQIIDEDGVEQIQHVAGKFKDVAKAMKEATAQSGKLRDGLKAGWAQLSLFGKGALIFAGIAATVGAAIWVYNNYADTLDAVSKRNQKLIDSSKEKTDTLKQEYDEYNNSANSLQQLLDQYREAEAGSEEYYAIRQQIAEQFPELVTGWDSEGNAILANTEIIQDQINKYRELAQAKEGAIIDATSFNIDSLVNPSSNAGIPALKQAVDDKTAENQGKIDKLKQQIKEIQEQEGDTVKVAYDYDSFTGEAKYRNESKSKVITDLENQIKQYYAEITSAQESYQNAVDYLKQSYAEITPDLSLDSQVTQDGVAYLQQFSKEALISAEDYLKFVDTIRSDATGEASQVLKDFISPDLSKIDVNDYADIMKQRLDAAMNALHIGKDKRQELIDAFGIDSTQQVFKNRKSSLMSMLSGSENDRIAHYIAGTSWSKIIGSLKADEIMTFDPDKFINDKVKEKLKDNYTDALKDLKEISAEELSEIDWTIPEDQYSSIQQSAMNVARVFGRAGLVDFQSPTFIQDAINLMQQFELVSATTTGRAADKWNEFADSTNTAINTLAESSTALSSAMAEQSKNGFLSQKTFESLTETYQGFADAISIGANGMQLNAKAAQEMINTQKHDISKKLNDQYDTLTTKYKKNKEEIESLTSKSEALTDAEKTRLSVLSQEQSQIQTRLTSWAKMNAQIEVSDSLYQKWLQSQEMGSDATMYDTIRGGWDTIKGKLDNERWADPEVLAYMEMITGQSMNGDKVYGQKKNIADFIKKYMTNDNEGVNDFLDMTEKALHQAGMERFFDENGDLNFAVGDEGMIAAAISDYMQNVLGKEGFSVSSELVKSMLDAGVTYDLLDPLDGAPTTIDELSKSIDEMNERLNSGEIEENSELWNQYTNAIADANRQIELYKIAVDSFKTPEELEELKETVNKGLEKDDQIDFDLEYDNAVDATVALNKLEEAKKALYDENGDFIDTENGQASLEALNELIKNTQAQLAALTNQTYVIDISGMEEGAEKDFAAKINELSAAAQAYKIAEATGDRTAGQKAREQIEGIVGDLREMNQLSNGQLSALFNNIDLTTSSTAIKSLGESGKTTFEQIQEEADRLNTKKAQQAIKDLNTTISEESASAAQNLGEAITTINSYTIGTLGSDQLLTNLTTIEQTMGRLTTSTALNQSGQQVNTNTKKLHKREQKGPNGDGGEAPKQETTTTETVIEYKATLDTTNFDEGITHISEEANTSVNDVGKINDVSLSSISGNLEGVASKEKNISSEARTAKNTINSINGVSVSGSKVLGSLHSEANSTKTVLSNINSELNKMNRTVNIKIKINRENSNGNGDGPGSYKGNAHFSLFKGNAFASGTIGAKKTEPSLVGELGPELRVRGTKWDLLGESGAEFRDVKKGDIIFNHKQTEELFKYGSINSRGVAYAGGSTGLDSLNKTLGNNGTIIINGDVNIEPVNTKRKPKKDSKDGDGNGNGGRRKGSGGNGDGKRSTTTKKKDKTDAFDKYLDKLFDWIEIRIERVQTKIDQLSSLAEEFLDRMAYGLSEKKYKDALEKIYEQIGNEDAAYDKYYAQAEEVFKKGMNQKGIPKKTKENQDALWDKILNGEIDINSYDEDTRKVIEGTQEWIDKAIEAKNALQELQAQAREYAKSLKEVHDAQRDAGVSLSDNFIQIAQSNFEARTDNAYQYSNGRLRYENRQRRKQIRIHRKATQENLQDFEEASKEVSIELDPLLAKEEAKLEKERVKNGTVKKSHKEYQTVLKRIKTAMDHNKPVKEKDISYIEKKNPQLAAQLVVYNQTLQNFEDAKMEEMLAVAENIQQIYQNYAQMYDNKNERLQNKINLRDKQIENKTTADGQNKLIDEQIKIAEAQKKNDRAKVEKFAKLRKENATKIKTTLKKGNATTEKYDANENKKVKSRVEKALTKVQKNIKAKVAIDGDTIGEIAELVNAGYIQASFLEACLSYNEAIEQGREAKAQAEINKETIRKENEQRRLQKMKNVQNQGEKDRYKYDRRKTKAQQRIDAAEAYGHYAQRNDYKNIIRQDVSMLAEYNAELAKQQKLLKDLTVGSDEWFEAKQIIAELEDSIEELNLDIHEQAMAMEKLNWQKFDDGIERAKRLNSEIDHYYNLISNEQFFDTDNQGNITQYGMAALDLKNTDYKANLAEAQQYLHEYNLLVKKINDPKNELDPTNQEVIDRMNELQDAYWGSMEAAEAAKQAVIDLARQGYEAQLTALNNTISKYKELKNAEKEAYDYQKQITEKANNITNLEKQLAAWQNNTSEESVSKIQKLQKDIKDARQDLRDAEYSKYLSDAQKMLDDLSANFQEWIDRYLKNRDKVLLKMQDLLADKIDALGVSSNATDTVNTLKQVDKNITDNLVGALKENGSLQNRIEAAVKSVIDDAARQPEEQAKAAFREKVSGYVGKEKDLKAKDYDAVRSIIKEYKGMSQEEKDALDDTTVTTVKNLSKKMNTIDKDSKTKQAKKTVDEAYSNFNTLNEQIAETKRNISQLNKERQEERSKFTKYKGQSRVGQLSEEALKAKQNYENKEREIQELERQLNRLEVQFANAKTRFDEAQDAYHKAKENSDAYHARWHYVTGIKSVPTDLNAWTQEKGLETIIRKSDGAILTPLGRGDAVFNAEMTDNLWKLAKMNIPDMFAKSFGSQPVINNTTNTTLSPNTTIQLSITLPNVKNYDEFKSALVADRNFQNAVQDMTLGAVLGKNSMSKYKYA